MYPEIPAFRVTLAMPGTPRRHEIGALIRGVLLPAARRIGDIECNSVKAYGAWHGYLSSA
jgi:hypothetical protein